MNIRFLAQSEYFNGIHLKDDIILEKEYMQGEFENIPRVKYFLYYLEENVRREVMPHLNKADIFTIINCQYESEYLYFTEYEKNEKKDGYHFNIIRYNINDHTHHHVMTLVDNVELYPSEKETKIFVIDEANILLQSALPRKNTEGVGFLKFSQILFNFEKKSRIVIQDENLQRNGIEYILPYDESNCVLKAGYSLIGDKRRIKLSQEESPVESLILLNIQQFISDLQLENHNLMLNAIDQSYYDSTIIKAKIESDFLIYSKINYDTNDETIIFHNLNTKDTYTCINKTSLEKSLINQAIIIENIPYFLNLSEGESCFFNLITNEKEAVYPKEFRIRYVNNKIIVASYIEKNLFGQKKEMVTIHKFPSKKIILQERGEYIGAVSSNKDTTYIFLK